MHAPLQGWLRGLPAPCHFVVTQSPVTTEPQSRVPAVASRRRPPPWGQNEQWQELGLACPCTTPLPGPGALLPHRRATLRDRYPAGRWLRRGTRLRGAGAGAGPAPAAKATCRGGRAAAQPPAGAGSGAGPQRQGELWAAGAAAAPARGFPLALPYLGVRQVLVPTRELLTDPGPARRTGRAPAAPAGPPAAPGLLQVSAVTLRGP